MIELSAPSFPGLAESLGRLPRIDAGDTAPLLILGAGGFLGALLCAAARQAGRLGMSARELHAATDHPSTFLAASVGPGVLWMSHDQALERVWPAGTIVACMFGSSLPWDEQASAAKSAEGGRMALWARKACRESLRLVLASSGACAQLDAQGRALECAAPPGTDDTDGPVAWNRLDYAETRRAWEHLVLSTPTPIVARVHSALGPALPVRKQWACWAMAEQLAAGHAAASSAPGLLRPWMHPADIAAWIWWLAMRGSGIYNLAPATGFTMADLARDLTSAWHRMPVSDLGGRPHKIETGRVQAAGLRPFWSWPDMVNGFSVHARHTLAADAGTATQ